MISDREPPWPARPNLLAMITSSRLPDFESAAPRNSSLLPPPYISAVSNSVMPASTAALTTSAVSPGPMRMPKLLQPRPSTDTARPELPTLRISTANLRTEPANLSGALPAYHGHLVREVPHRLGPSIRIDPEEVVRPLQGYEPAVRRRLREAERPRLRAQSVGLAAQHQHR